MVLNWKQGMCIVVVLISPIWRYKKNGLYFVTIQPYQNLKRINYTYRHIALNKYLIIKKRASAKSFNPYQSVMPAMMNGEIFLLGAK